MKMISVIVPVYNTERYLADTIQSILQQTYRDFELILVDDGSKDSSLEVCISIAEKDERVIVVHQENQGVSAARNTGIDRAQGKYICFIDSDDYVEVDMLECLVKNAEEYQADISCCGLVQVSLEGKVKNHYCHGEKVQFKDMTKLMQAFFTEPIYKEILYGPYNKIVRTEIVKNVCFNHNYTIAEDLLFNFECLEKASVFYLENRELYHYMKRENSISTSKFAEKEFDYIYVADILLDKCKANYPSIAEAALVWNYQQKLNICRRLWCHNEYRKKYKNLYNTWKNFCVKNKPVVWKNISSKNRVEYMVLRSCPWIFAVVRKILHK